MDHISVVCPTKGLLPLCCKPSSPCGLSTVPSPLWEFSATSRQYINLDKSDMRFEQTATVCR